MELPYSSTQVHNTHCR